MRRVNRRQALKVVKELDAFPKVPESYQATSTTTGGTLSLLTFLLIAILVVSEFFYYLDSQMRYEYKVDVDLKSKLQINVDITVAMECHSIGSDVLDMTGEMFSSSFGRLKEEAVQFEPTPEETFWLTSMQSIRETAAKEHAIQDLLFKSGYDPLKFRARPNPTGKDGKSAKRDACRFYGTLEVNKVAGNFHVTIGKSIPHPRGHAHLAALIDTTKYNFSHRINHFSFGVQAPGIINPLDGVQKITKKNLQMYQYFVQIVPTDVNTRAARVNTHQFAVTENERAVNHSAGSHGVSGIFFKYDLSSVMIKVTEEHQPFSQFLIRLCGIIGGIFATSGMLHSLVGFLHDVICCRYNMGKYEGKPTSTANSSNSSQLPVANSKEETQ